MNKRRLDNLIRLSVKHCFGLPGELPCYQRAKSRFKLCEFEGDGNRVCCSRLRAKLNEEVKS